MKTKVICEIQQSFFFPGLFLFHFKVCQKSDWLQQTDERALLQHKSAHFTMEKLKFVRNGSKTSQIRLEDHKSQFPSQFTLLSDVERRCTASRFRLTQCSGKEYISDSLRPFSLGHRNKYLAQGTFSTFPQAYESVQFLHFLCYFLLLSPTFPGLYTCFLLLSEYDMHALAGQ